jgi:hypothetical protein
MISQSDCVRLSGSIRESKVPRKLAARLRVTSRMLIDSGSAAEVGLSEIELREDSIQVVPVL